MKKIPTLFERVYENHKIVDILPNVTVGMEWVLDGDGVATVKWDGSCCAIINGEFYKRYDAKKGKKIPDGAIKCQDEPDKVTGHMPCWVKCDRNNPADKWFVEAEYITSMWSNQGLQLPDGTYEAVGKHFQGNPYNFKSDQLVKHGENIIEVERTFDGIKQYLHDNYIEGIVFWLDNEPRCKIKRTDFGFEWNGKERK
jgi:hypothetical protein